MWLAAGVSAKLGIDEMNADTGDDIGYWAASVIVALMAMIWSNKKDKKLAKTEPPKSSED